MSCHSLHLRNITSLLLLPLLLRWNHWIRYGSHNIYAPPTLLPSFFDCSLVSHLISWCRALLFRVWCCTNLSSPLLLYHFTGYHYLTWLDMTCDASGRCTLLSALMQQQIMMLESIIAAYTLSALSLHNARSSERQMMASSWWVQRLSTHSFFSVYIHLFMHLAAHTSDHSAIHQVDQHAGYLSNYPSFIQQQQQYCLLPDSTVPNYLNG